MARKDSFVLCSRSSTLPSNLIHLSTFQIQTQQSQLLVKSSEANVSCTLILVLSGFTLCTVVQRYTLIFVRHLFQLHQLCIALIVFFLYRCCPDEFYRHTFTFSEFYPRNPVSFFLAVGWSLANVQHPSSTILSFLELPQIADIPATPFFPTPSSFLFEPRILHLFQSSWRL